MANSTRPFHNPRDCKTSAMGIRKDLDGNSTRCFARYGGLKIRVTDDAMTTLTSDNSTDGLIRTTLKKEVTSQVSTCSHLAANDHTTHALAFGFSLHTIFCLASSFAIIIVTLTALYNARASRQHVCCHAHVRAGPPASPFAQVQYLG